MYIDCRLYIKIRRKKENSTKQKKSIGELCGMDTIKFTIRSRWAAAGMICQMLTALAIFAEDQGSIHSTHTVAQNHV